MPEGVTYDETLQLLVDLVRANSEDPPGSTETCVQIISHILEAEGIEYKIVEPKAGIQNIVARIPGEAAASEKGKTLLFNGHLDTVPAGEGWTVDPFGAEIKDGYLYGRGSTDMKAGVAASLMACIDLNRKGRPFKGEILYTAVGDEEYHSEYGTKWLLSHGLTADYAVNCEPTNLDICLGNRGLLMVDVLVKGRSSHGGRPGLGKNAITIASDIIKKLETIDHEDGRDDNFKDPVGSISIVGMHGGDRINVIPDRCVFYIDRRLMPTESGEAAITQIERTIEEVTGALPARNDMDGQDIVIKPEIWHEPFWMEKDHPFVNSFVEQYRDYFKRDPIFEGKSAGTDASHLVKIGKIPTVVFGPGDYRTSHTVDEKVELAQLMKAVGFYSHLVQKVLT